jgi:uncharacterized protein YcbK (DUF882 family)
LQLPLCVILPVRLLKMSQDLNNNGFLNLNLSRRSFVTGASSLVAGVAASCVWASPTLASTPNLTMGGELRDLSMYNQNTRETLDTIFFEQGHYKDDSLKQLCHFLRDHHVNRTHWMDPRLMTMLYDLQTIFDKKRIEVISGYRTPETNARLRRTMAGVGKDSYHMQGRAVDIRIHGVDVKLAFDVAKTLDVGGVGFYPRANFIHIDTGPNRYWVG